MRLYVLALMIAVVATPTSALAKPHPRTTTYTGSILVAHYALNGVTDLGAACDPKSPLNGADGEFYKIPRGSTHVTFAPSAYLAADLQFRTADCQSVSYSDGGYQYAQGFGHLVSGPVPAKASFVLVNGRLGTGAFIIKFIG